MTCFSLPSTLDTGTACFGLFFNSLIPTFVTQDSTTTIAYDDIPWPPDFIKVQRDHAAEATVDSSGPCGSETPRIGSGVTLVLPEDPPKVRKDKVRLALRRWHPDKFQAVLARVPEETRGAVAFRVHEVALRIIAEKKRAPAAPAPAAASSQDK